MSAGDVRLIAWGGIAALMLAMGIGRFVYTPILPDMIGEGVLDVRSGGWLASVNFIGYLLGALLAMVVATRRARLDLLRAALLVSVASTAAMALGSTLPLWIGLRLASGIASAFVLVFTSYFALEAFARAGKPSWGGWLYAGVGLGVVVSSLLVEILQRLDVAWPGLWLAAGALAALLAVPALIATGHLPVAAPAQPLPDPAGSGEGKALAHWLFPLLVISYCGLGFGYSVQGTYLPTIVRAVPELATLGTLTWLIVGLAGAPSNPAWDAVGRKLGRPQAMTLAYLVQAAGLFAPLLWPSAWGAIIGALTLGGTIMAITALGLAEARALRPRATNRALALMTASFGVGQIAGPLTAAYLVGPDHDFLPPTIVAAAVLALAAAMMAIVSRAKN